MYCFNCTDFNTIYIYTSKSYPCKALAVLDRADSCSGTFAPVYSDVVAAMYANGVTGPKTENYVYGLGGREIDMTHIADVFKHLDEVAKGKAQASKTVEYINVRIK